MNIILIIIIITLILYLIFNHVQLNKVIKELKLKNQLNVSGVIRNRNTTKQLQSLLNEINIIIDNNHSNTRKYNEALLSNKEMSTSIAHDFRTPLTAMQGYVQVLESRASEEDIPFLKIINQRINNLNSLVESFYQINLLDSNEYPINLSKINPLLILQNELSIYYHELSNHFEIINIDIDEVSYLINSDEKILIRIYDNLIKNALVHGFNVFSIKTIINNDNLKIIFSNSFDGLEKYNLDDIFKRSYTIKKERSSGGNGLGLSINKSLGELIDVSYNAYHDEDNIYIEMIINNEIVLP